MIGFFVALSIWLNIQKIRTNNNQLETYGNMEKNINGWIVPSSIAERGVFMGVIPIPARALDRIHYLPVDLIRKNSHQPRKSFDDHALYELSESIKQYGVIQPITVRAADGYHYELIAGERRLRAARLAGLVRIPAIISNMDDKDSAVIAVIENLQREDLNFVEEAESFIKLIREFGFTQEALAKRIGKSQSSVANKMRILKLPRRVLRTLVENNLTERHGRALLSLPSEELQDTALERIISEKLTVKKTEELVAKLLNPGKKKSKKNVKVRLKDVKIFVNTLKQSLGFMERAGFLTEIEMEDKEEGYEFWIKVKPGS